MKKIVFLLLIIHSLASFGQNEKKQSINSIDSTETFLKTDTIYKLVYIKKVIETKAEPVFTKHTETESGNFNYIKSKWIDFVSLLIAFLVFIIPIYRFLSQKREEQRDKRFITYHQLIADLVNPPTRKLDNQIATVFELRNFPKYFDLTKRIMTDLKDQWSQDSDNERLLTEMCLAIKHIEKKSKSFWKKKPKSNN